MDITHDNVCSSMLSCFYSHLLSTGRPISSSTCLNFDTAPTVTNSFQLIITYLKFSILNYYYKSVLVILEVYNLPVGHSLFIYLILF